MEQKVLAGEVVEVIVLGKSLADCASVDTSTPGKHSTHVQTIAQLLQAQPGQKGFGDFQISDEPDN